MSDLKLDGAVSYLPENTRHCKRQVADGLYVIISSYSRDVSTMKLVDEADNRLTIIDYPAIQLLTRLEPIGSGRGGWTG